MTTRPPSPPYRGPAAHHGAPDNKPIHRIVIHSTVSPCVRGGAENVARYFRTTTHDASAHYVVDPGTTLQVVYDSVVAYHAPPNKHSIGVELCDMPTQDLERWRDPNHQAMMKRASRLVAHLCLAYRVPPYFLNARQLQQGAHGVTTHAEVSEAWEQTDHWDPGAWPRREFMRAVRANYRELGTT